MTQVAKELLLKDLCARLPYHPKINIYNDSWEGCRIGEFDNELWYHHIEAFNCDRIEIIPYLRPMSSMTEIERQKFLLASGYVYIVEDAGRYTERGYKDYVGTDNEFSPNYDAIDWLNEHHFDYRELIERGLALPAKKGMYKTE